jgi:hypothetical protein
MTRHRRLMLASLFMISLFGLSAGPQNTSTSPSTPSPSEFQSPENVADSVTDDSPLHPQIAETFTPKVVQPKCTTATAALGQSGITLVHGSLAKTSVTSRGVDLLFVCSNPGKLRYTVTRSSFLVQQFPSS